MKLVIEITEELYNKMVDVSKLPELELAGDFTKEFVNSVVKGTPLPKNHGRLIDADKTIARLCKNDCKQTNGECKYFTRCSFWDAIQEAETIIPATENEFFNFDAPIIKNQTAME